MGDIYTYDKLDGRKANFGGSQIHKLICQPLLICLTSFMKNVYKNCCRRAESLNNYSFRE